MAAGTSTSLTRLASSAMATARANPICLSSRRLAVRKLPKTATMIAAAAEIARIPENIRGQHVEVDPRDTIARRHDDRALDDVAQLADVAGPGIVEQLLPGFVVEIERRPAVLPAEVVEEVIEQQLDVFPAIAKGRDVQLEYAQAIEQVFAEFPLPHVSL